MMYTCIIMAVKQSENKSLKIRFENQTFQDIFEYATQVWKRYKVKGISQRSNPTRCLYKDRDEITEVGEL